MVEGTYQIARIEEQNWPKEPPGVLINSGAQPGVGMDLRAHATRCCREAVPDNRGFGSETHVTGVICGLHLIQLLT